MTQAAAPGTMSRSTTTALVAWLITALYFFYQYMLRSAPAVMMPQLSAAFGLTTTGVASMLGMFYYGYSPFSLVAGAAIDGFGGASSIGSATPRTRTSPIATPVSPGAPAGQNQPCATRPTADVPVAVSSAMSPPFSTR